MRLHPDDRPTHCLSCQVPLPTRLHNAGRPRLYCNVRCRSRVLRAKRKHPDLIVAERTVAALNFRLRQAKKHLRAVRMRFATEVAA